MKIPKILKINGHIYQVKFKDNKIDSGDGMGAICRSSGIIWIDENQTQTQKESTLIHEIIESINIDYDLRLPHQTISTFEVAFYQILKDNKLIK